MAGSAGGGRPRQSPGAAMPWWRATATHTCEGGQLGTNAAMYTNALLPMMSDSETSSQNTRVHNTASSATCRTAPQFYPIAVTDMLARHFREAGNSGKMEARRVLTEVPEDKAFS